MFFPCDRNYCCDLELWTACRPPADPSISCLSISNDRGRPFPASRPLPALSLDRDPFHDRGGNDLYLDPCLDRSTDLSTDPGVSSAATRPRRPDIAIWAKRNERKSEIEVRSVTWGAIESCIRAYVTLPEGSASVSLYRIVEIPVPVSVRRRPSSQRPSNRSYVLQLVLVIVVLRDVHRSSSGFLCKTEESLSRCLSFYINSLRSRSFSFEFRSVNFLQPI